MEDPIASALAELTETVDPAMRPLLDALADHPHDAEAVWLEIVEDALREA